MSLKYLPPTILQIASMFFPHFCLSLPCGQLFPIYSPASQHRKGRAGHAGDRRYAVHLVVEVREDPRGLLERREHHLPVHRQACADIRPFGRKMSYRIMMGGGTGGLSAGTENCFWSGN